MKNLFSILLAIGVVFCTFLAIAPKAVEATGTNVAAGVWTTGVEVNVDAYATSPTEWMSLLTNGVKVTEPGKICHPFRGGQFHWVGEIRKLQEDHTWKKLVTTNAWVPTTEGQFMSCAQAPSAGTYALFGYYNGPREVPVKGITDVDVSITKGSIIFGYSFMGGSVTYTQAQGSPYYLNTTNSFVKLRGDSMFTLSGTAYFKDLDIDENGYVTYETCADVGEDFNPMIYPMSVLIHLEGPGWSRNYERPLNSSEVALFAAECLSSQ